MKLAQLQQNRRFLLALPLLVLPFLILVFHSLHGGANPPDGKQDSLGLNTQLPSPTVDPNKAFENKLKAYQQAENDSTRKAQYQRQDPYRRDTVTQTLPDGPAAVPQPKPKTPPTDNRADQLLQQLARLQQSLHQSAPPVHRSAPTPLPRESIIGQMPVHPRDPEPDPQLDHLNTMLDKLIRIQHPPTQQPAATQQPDVTVGDIGPADTTVNSIRAMIPENQILTAGATVALRLTDSIRVHHRTLASGRLMYGTSSFDNDRLMIHIHSLREDANLYSVDWQVYDLDGLPGIHMPSLLSRDIAKQSADQGISSVNILSADQSVGAQAAGAGIQAAKSFLAHKVRQIRVTIPSGYQVLLRNTHQQPHNPLQIRTPKQPIPLPGPPDFEPATGKLAKSHVGGVQLTLKDIRIRDTCLWFGLEWINHSSILFRPAYARWWIRPRKTLKRTATQDQTLQPLVSPPLPLVGKDSAQYAWFGFKPFALANDKQFLLEIGEEGGQRVLTLTIQSNHLLNAKTDEIPGKE